MPSLNMIPVTNLDSHGDDQPSLADQRASVTRDAIISAVQHLLVHEHPATISVPAVAKQAGISVRTIYRYFPNKQALLGGVANYFPDRTLGQGHRIYGSVEESTLALKDLWGTFGENLPAVRAEHMSPAGSDLRQRRLTETRSQMNKYVAHRFQQGSEPDRERLADMLVAVTSSSMFLELTDRLGYTPEQSADIAMKIAAAVISDFASRHADPTGSSSGSETTSSDRTGSDAAGSAYRPTTPKDTS